MYTTILTSLSIFILFPFLARADGCHDGKDDIGCPTLWDIATFSTAINNFCTWHAQPSPLTIPVGTSWPGKVYSLPMYDDIYGTPTELWGE